MRFDFRNLQSLLRRRIDDAGVAILLGADSSRLERDEYYGSVVFESDGVEIVLKEAPWVLPPHEVTDPHALHVSAYHFHREGHEDFAGYAGELLGGVTLNDSKAEVRRKLGDPLSSGGDVSSWYRYSLANALLNLQFDTDGNLEMGTLFAEEPKSK